MSNKKRGKKPLTSQTPATKGYQPFDLRFYHREEKLPPLSFNIIRDMMLDPTVKLGLAMRAAPICSAEFAYKTPGSDEWTEGIEADDPLVAAFVLRQLKRIWQDIAELLKAQVWGWAAAEVMFRHVRPGEGEASRHFVEIDRLLPRHACDSRMILCGGEPHGVRFLRITDALGGQVDLPFPKSVFHNFNPEPGQHYGMPVLHGAYSSWADKNFPGGARAVRRLFMQKDAYRGPKIFYPNDTYQTEENGVVRTIHARDIARQNVEQIKSGGVQTYPSDVDPVSKLPRWRVEETVVTSNPAHILQYPKDLDTEILRGMEVPDDIFTADTDTSGAWAGKKVPLDGFYTGLDLWLSRLLRDLKKQLIDHLVAMNFGPGRWYELRAKPLAEQAMERQSKQGPQGAQPPKPFGGGFNRDGDSDGQHGESGNGFPPRQNRMSLDIEEAVGRGTVRALDLVGAARKAVKKRTVAKQSQNGHSRGSFAND